MLYTALQHDGPVAIRYQRGSGTGVKLQPDYERLEIGKAAMLRRGEDVLFICFGPLVQYALEAADRLLRERGISASVMNARFAKPLDEELLAREIPAHEMVCTLEDHSLSAGFGAAILEFMNDKGVFQENSLWRFGVRDCFVPHASQFEQHAMNAYDPESIFRTVAARVSTRKALSAG